MSSRQVRWRDETLSLALVLGLATVFFLAFFNRFAGVRSGDGEYGGGLALLAGRLPYRDYFTSGPPLNQIKSAIELAVFGKALIVSRAAGVAERLLIAAVLYVWLRLSFSRLATAVATVVTVIVSAGDRTDPIASYNHDAIFFAMLCGLMATLAFERVRIGKSAAGAGFALASGCAAGLSALTKQTVGLGTLVGVLVVGTLAFAYTGGARRAMVWVTAFVAGAAVPVVATGFYLQRLGVLSAALNMLFVSAPKAKAGRPLDFLTRDVAIGIDNWPWVLLAVIAMAMSAGAIRRSLLAAGVEERADRRQLLFVGCGCFALLAGGILLSLTPLPAVWNFSKGPVYYTFAGTAIVGLAVIVGAMRRLADTERLWRLGILATVGWCVAFTLSLSWPAFEAMTLPGLGLLLAAAVDGVRRGRPVLYALLGVTVFFQMREKLDLPFSFDNQDEPSVRFATQSSSLPGLRGMRLPAETVRLLESSTRVMRSRAQGEDTVFTYPEMSLVYSLSGKVAPTWSGSHNIDTTNDDFARQEAGRLLQRQPVVILYARPTEEQLRDAESTWRHGARSGQRDLMHALDCLTSQYQLVDTFQLLPQDVPIRLYARAESQNEPVACPLMK